MDPAAKITPEEREAFSIVRAILSKTISPERVTYGDTKTYFAIRLDNNNFRPICRMYLRKNRKYIGTINGRKVETRYKIDSVEDILKFSHELIKKVAEYEKW